MKEELQVAQQVYNTIVDFLVNYSFQLLGAVVILVAGFIVGGWVSRAVLNLQERRNVDVTLRHFIASVARLGVIALFVLIALSKIGISMAPLVAAVGGLAVGASFAIQGPVSNYGAGLIIILTRMFKVGDTITVQGYSGVVAEITLATTQLVAEDGEDIVIPNKHIVGEIYRNSYTNRSVTGRIGIDYGDDPQVAIRTIRAALSGIAAVAAAPLPQVGIEEFADSEIAIGYRYWVPTRSYFEVRHEVNLAVFAALAAAGITVPYPRRDVRLIEPRARAVQ